MDSFNLHELISAIVMDWNSGSSLCSMSLYWVLPRGSETSQWKTLTKRILNGRMVCMKVTWPAAPFLLARFCAFSLTIKGAFSHLNDSFNCCWTAREVVFCYILCACPRARRNCVSLGGELLGLLLSHIPMMGCHSSVGGGRGAFWWKGIHTEKRVCVFGCLRMYVRVVFKILAFS